MPLAQEDVIPVFVLTSEKCRKVTFGLHAASIRCTPAILTSVGRVASRTVQRVLSLNRSRCLNDEDTTTILKTNANLLQMDTSNSASHFKVLRYASTLSRSSKATASSACSFYPYFSSANKKSTGRDEQSCLPHLIPKLCRSRTVTAMVLLNREGGISRHLSGPLGFWTPKMSKCFKTVSPKLVLRVE